MIEFINSLETGQPAGESCEYVKLGGVDGWEEFRERDARIHGWCEAAGISPPGVPNRSNRHGLYIPAIVYPPWWLLAADYIPRVKHLHTAAMAFVGCEREVAAMMCDISKGRISKRPQTPGAASLWQFTPDGFRFDGSAPVGLKATPMQLLRFILAKKDNCFSRKQLKEAWADPDAVSDQNVNMCLTSIRKAVTQVVPLERIRDGLDAAIAKGIVAPTFAPKADDPIPYASTNSQYVWLLPR